MSVPRLSVILINYKQVELTMACLESLRRATWPNLEVIVVDNASRDGSVERLRAGFPEVALVENDDNLGFTGGNNTGIRVATGDWVLLLNNDTEVEPGFAEPLMAAVRRDPTIGAASPKIRFFHTPDTLQYAGAEPIDLGRGRCAWRGWGERDEGRYARVEETAAAHGAAFLVSRDVLDRVGLLDEAWFIFFEELDWSLRIRDAGFRIVVVPDSLVLHKESMTVPKESPFRTYHMARNRIWLVRRHGSAGQRAFFAMWSTALGLPWNLGRMIARRRADLARELLRGSWHGWTWALSAPTSV